MIVPCPFVKKTRQKRKCAAMIYISIAAYMVGYVLESNYINVIMNKENTQKYGTLYLYNIQVF